MVRKRETGAKTLTTFKKCPGPGRFRRCGGRCRSTVTKGAQRREPKRREIKETGNQDTGNQSYREPEGGRRRGGAAAARSELLSCHTQPRHHVPLWSCPPTELRHAPGSGNGPRTPTTGQASSADRSMTCFGAPKQVRWMMMAASSNVALASAGIVTGLISCHRASPFGRISFEK